MRSPGPRQFPGNPRLVQMHQVTKIYTGQAGPVMALKGIDLEIERGEFLAVTGRSGAGKTTLVNVLTALDPLSSGEIWVDGVAVHHLSENQAAAWRGRNMGIIFQSFQLLPTLSVLQNVTLPMDFAGFGTLAQRRERGLALLEQVDIREHAFKRPAAVSGGQQQRVAIARALANQPPLLVADEPTGSLDSVTAAAIVQLFRDLVRQGKTILMVTHDADLAHQADRVIGLADGEILSGGETCSALNGTKSSATCGATAPVPF